MGAKGGSSDTKRVTVVGPRRLGLRVSETADLLFLHKYPVTEQQFSRRTLVDIRG